MVYDASIENTGEKIYVLAEKSIEFYSGILRELLYLLRPNVL
jgi:hypothetical protein